MQFSKSVHKFVRQNTANMETEKTTNIAAEWVAKKIIKLEIPLLMLRNTVVLYFLVYAVTCFVMWEIRNPFLWIINLPKYSEFDRGIIAFSWSFYMVMNYLFSKDFLNPTK